MARDTDAPAAFRVFDAVGDAATHTCHRYWKAFHAQTQSKSDASRETLRHGGLDLNGQPISD
jgi:hypothetical protein